MNTAAASAYKPRRHIEPCNRSTSRASPTNSATACSPTSPQPSATAAVGASNARRFLQPTWSSASRSNCSPVLDLYAAIVATGVELTRAGHEALTELCTRRKHLRLAAELGQIVAIRLEISFLDDITIHSLLASGSGLA